MEIARGARPQRAVISPIDAWEHARQELRILLVVSSPVDEPERLNVDLEIQEIYRQLLWTRVPAALIRLHPPTWRALQVTLHARPFDIVHFIGHARRDGLQLEREDGSGDWVAAADLAVLFRDTGVKLVVLNNCSSESLGDSLVAAGIPAVIATARHLQSGTATLLSGSLYANLAGGSSLQAAVDFIRRTLKRERHQEEPVVLLGPGADEPLTRAPLGPGDATFFACEPTHNLPASAARRFVDRTAELLRLAELLDQGQTPFIGITGLAGSGKSTLAIEAARRYSWRFTHGIAYASLRRMRPFDLNSLLAHFDWGLEEMTGAKQRRIALYELSRGPLLLLLDDLEEARPQEVREILELLSAWDTSLGGRALLIMRHRRPEFDQLIQTAWLTVGALPGDAAYAFLEERLGGAEAARVRLGSQLEELPRLCYYHPNLLTLTASALEIGIPWQELATQLQHLTGGPLKQVEQVLALTIAQIEKEMPVAGQFLDCWPLFAETTGEAAWRFVQAGRPLTHADALWHQQNAALENLQRANILQRTPGEHDEQCRMHPLISDYLRHHRWNRLSPEKRAEYVRRHLHYYIEMFRSQAERFPLLAEWENILRTVEQALTGSHQRENLEELLALAELLVGGERPLLGRHLPRHAVQLLTLALEAARRLQKGHEQAVFLLELGKARYRLAEYQEARQAFEKGLALARQLGEARLIRQATLQLGQVAYRQTRYEEARALFEELRRLAEGAGDGEHLAEALHELGRLAYRLARLEEAAALLAEALRLREQSGDGEGIARTLHEQARVAHERACLSGAAEQFEEAEALYQRSLALRKAAGDRIGQQATIHQLGLLAFDRGDYERAGLYYAECMQLAEELNDRFWIAHNRFRQARLLWRLGRRQQAKEQASEALALASVLGIGLQQEIAAWLKRPL
jgi:tetratricopeptide (TPR) repeat protein